MVLEGKLQTDQGLASCTLHACAGMLQQTREARRLSFGAVPHLWLLQVLACERGDLPVPVLTHSNLVILSHSLRH